VVRELFIVLRREGQSVVKWVIVIVLAVGGWYGWTNREAKAGKLPTAVQTEAAVRDYLLGARPCTGGRVDITQLENIRVQKWSPELRAWPVLADFSVVCEKPQVSTTWNGSGGSAATCFITVQDGNYRCGVPAALGKAVGEMNDSIRKEMESSMKGMFK
jgi:hypothetical protein